MRIEGSYQIAAPRQRVWDVLLNPDALAAAIPGCEGLELQDDGRYLAKLRAGVAAIKGSFTGHVQLTDEQAPSHYKLVVDGSGGPGFVKGEGSVNLIDHGDTTEVTVVGEAQVGGLIASVGQRVLQPAAKMMMNQFFNAMKNRIEQE